MTSSSPRRRSSKSSGSGKANSSPLEFGVNQGSGQTVDISSWTDGRIRTAENPVYTEWFAVAKGEEVIWTSGEGDNGKHPTNLRIKPCLKEYPALSCIE